MKRSEINQAIQSMIDLAASLRFALPPFAHWSPGDWANKGSAFDDIRGAALGWDVTDFGKNDFASCGLTLLTIRNGRPEQPEGKPYCEKLMMVRPAQLTPMHFHWKKTEDIINRGGGPLICRVYPRTTDERLGDGHVSVIADGRHVEVAAGTELNLDPGESITLTPGVYHDFWGARGGEPVLVGEVSSVNDDAMDNRFLDELPRYPGITEDEAPIRLLCTEYPDAK